MLQTWDEATGAPMLALTDRMFKFAILTSVGWSYTGGQQSGQISDPRFTRYPGCELQAFAVGANFDTRGGALQLTPSGGIVYWKFPLAASIQQTRPNTTFFCGIF